MTSEEYLNKLNEQVQQIFQSSIAESKDVINEGLNIVKTLQSWHSVIFEDGYKTLITNCTQSLEISIFSQSYCFYRSAFTALRLSLEMLFGGIYFSTNKLDFLEWTKSSKDLNWSVINDENNGVLSHRFVNAFFPELLETSKGYFTMAKELYRSLSEHVHGNSETWISGAPVINIDKQAISDLKISLNKFHELSIFALSLRFLNELSKQQLEQVESSILQKLNHIRPIHDFLSK